MTIRIIMRETNIADACNVGGPVHISHHTFDVDLPEIERILQEPKVNSGLHYLTREVVGVEIKD